MEDVEGVAPEETTVSESVENPTPPETEEVPADEGETEVEETPEGESDDEPESEGLTDEALEKLLNDPKVQAKLDKEVKIKTARQQAANRKLQEKVDELQRLRDLKPLVKPEITDFETDEDFQKANQEYEEEIVNRRADEKLAEKQANQAANEKIDNAREIFATKEAEVQQANPDYATNTAVVQEYIDMIDPNDAGFKAFGEHMAFEADNAPALLNHLGKHPEKIEALLGKPPALIKRKLAAYEKEIQTPKPPQAKPLPTPPTKTKGAAKANVPVAKRSVDDVMKWVNS